MKIDCVFSGGGVKAYAFMGALQSINYNNLHIERVAGTSAGAIIASLLAAGYKINEIQELMTDLNLEHFLDSPKVTKILPFTKWLFLYFQLGIYKGDKFEDWLRNLLATKGVFTFKDLKQDYLKVIVSDLTLGKLVVIPDDLMRLYNIDPNYFSVAKAVRMSAGFPYFFMPKKLIGINQQKSIMVDGGLLSNFPLWVFEDDHQTIRRPVLGVKLSSSFKNNYVQTTKNAFDMFHALFSTMKLAHDARYISTSKKDNIIFIPIENINTINFHITQETKKELFEIGKKNADIFLKYWPK